MSKKNEPKYSPLKKFFTRLLGFLTNPSVCVGLIIFLILVVIMLVIYASEKDRNDNINTLFDAIWYTIVTITTVGYGDITPVSVFGRISAITLLVVGVAIFGALSGKFASFLLDRQQKKDRGLLTMEKMKNHFLICGWKPNFEKILEGVLIANPEVSPENIVLLNNADRSCMEVIQSKEDFKGINYIHGDFTEDATLIKAQIKTAERVLILADASENYSTLEIDSRTVLAVITIKNLNPRIYCVAEIFDSKFEKHLSLARCDEIILTKDYEQNLLVQASSGKGMSHILRELISEETKSGIILAPIPDKCVGITYGEYRKSLKTKDILIGILENTGNFYMRRKRSSCRSSEKP